MLLVVNAIGFYALPLYIGVLAEESGFTAGVTSASSSLFFIASGVGGLAVAPLLQRWRSEAVIAIGAVATSLGAVLIGYAAQPWHLLAAFTLLSFSNFACGSLAVTTVLIRRRGAGPTRNQAIAIALTGMTAAGVVVAPTLTVLVESAGIRRATLVAGLVSLALVLIATAAGLRSVPDGPRSGTRRSGDAPLARARSTAADRRSLVLASVVFALFMCAQIGVVTQMYSLAVDRGVANVGLVLALVASMGLAARLIGVVLVRVVQPALFLGGMAAFQAVAALELALAPTEWGVFCGAALLGCAVGNASVLMPLVTLQLFGSAQFPPKLARISLLASLAGAAGPVLSGALREATDGFGAALVAVSVLSAAAAVAAVRVNAVAQRVAAAAGNAPPVAAGS